MSLRDIKARVDLLKLIGREVKLHPTLPGRFRGLCPWHTDSHRGGSLQVTPATRSWRCFGCDRKGSAIDWLMLRQGLSLREAAELLEDQGISTQGARP